MLIKKKTHTQIQKYIPWNLKLTRGKTIKENNFIYIYEICKHKLSLQINRDNFTKMIQLDINSVYLIEEIKWIIFFSSVYLFAWTLWKYSNVNRNIHIFTFLDV